MVDDLAERLDILIRLQAAALIAPLESMKEKIIFLHKAGLRPNQIADLLETSANNVSVQISKTKRPTAKEKKNG